MDGLCRVEPNASSHVFLVHGQACAKSEHHPTCSHTEEGTTPMGKLYAIDFEEIMAEDWRVRAVEAFMKNPHHGFRKRFIQAWHGQGCLACYAS